MTAPDPFGHYKSFTLRQPHLTREQEVEFLARFQAGDRQAGDVVALAMLGFVVSIALKYARRYKHVALEDFVAEGNLGLLDAMRRFDPARGCRLTTVSDHWIRCRMGKLVLRDWSIVTAKDAAFRSANFSRIQRAMREAQVKVGNDLDALELAASQMKIDPEKFERMLHRIIDRDASLDITPENGGPSFVARLVSFDSPPLAELETKQETERARHRVRTLLGHLDARERYIVLNTYATDEPASLAALGRELGISRERARQLQARAMRRLRKLLGSTYVPATNSRMVRRRTRA